MSIDSCGFLFLDCPWTRNTCRKIEETVDGVITDLSTEIVEENHNLEVELLPKISNGEITDLVCGFDFGWQQQGSGNVHNSASGHEFLTGARTKKVSKKNKIFF